MCLALGTPTTMPKRSPTSKPKSLLGHGHPRPLLQRQSWTSLNGAWDFALDPKARWRTPREVTWNAHDRRALRAGDGGERRRRHRLLPRAAGTAGASRPPTLRHGRAPASCTSARSTTRRTVWVNGALARRHEGGYTPFCARRHRSAGAERRRRRSSCAPRTIPPTSPSRAASRTGSSSRTRSGIRAPPASGRRSGWRSSRATRIGTRRAGRRTSSAGRSAFEACDGRGAPRERLRLAVKLRAGDRLLADDTLRGRRRRGAPPHRALGSRDRRLPQRAAVEPRRRPR